MKDIPIDWLQSQADEARTNGEDRVARIIEALIKRYSLLNQRHKLKS